MKYEVKALHLFGRPTLYNDRPEEATNIIIPKNWEVTLHWEVENAKEVVIEAQYVDSTDNVERIPMPNGGRTPTSIGKCSGEVTHRPKSGVVYWLSAYKGGKHSDYYGSVSVTLMDAQLQKPETKIVSDESYMMVSVIDEDYEKLSKINSSQTKKSADIAALNSYKFGDDDDSYHTDLAKKQASDTTQGGKAPLISYILGQIHQPQLMNFIAKTQDIWAELKISSASTKEDKNRVLGPFIAAQAKAVSGFGVGNIEKKYIPKNYLDTGKVAKRGERGQAYGDICFLFEPDNDTNGNNTSYATTISHRNDTKPKNSSCGVVVRSIWQRLGARHTDYIDPPYSGKDTKGYDKSGKVMNYLRDYAVYCGAFYGTFLGSHNEPTKNGKECTSKPLDFDNFDPKLGDAIFVYDPKKTGSEHVFTIVEIVTSESTQDQKVFISCDGGQCGDIAYDGTCNGIRLRKHTCTKSIEMPNDIKIITAAARAGASRRVRAVTGWVKTAELKFTGNLVTVRRNKGENYLPYPDSTF